MPTESRLLITFGSSQLGPLWKTAGGLHTSFDSYYLFGNRSAARRRSPGRPFPLAIGQGHGL